MSSVYRQTILQLHAPDELRGRLQGVFTAVVAGGPRLGGVRAGLTPPAFGPALALEYRRLLVPVVTRQPSDHALDVACSLAAERGARLVALNVLEVALDRPLAADLAPHASAA